MTIPDCQSLMRHVLADRVDGMRDVRRRGMTGSPRMPAGLRFTDVITSCAAGS
jgi:hypothetical protein